MQFLKILATGAAVSALLAGSAYAADLGGGMKDEPGNFEAPLVNWTGLYVGVQGGYGNANHEVNVSAHDEDESFEILNFDGINSRGFVGGITGGFDLARQGTVFGVLGGYTLSNMESSLSLFDGAAEWSLEKQNEWYVGARLGRVVAPRTLVYILAAYTQTEYELSGSGIDATSKTYNGIKAGIGGEYALGSNFFAGLEYTHDFYGDATWVDEHGIKVTDSLDEDKIMATLKLKLNGGLGVGW